MDIIHVYQRDATCTSDWVIVEEVTNSSSSQIYSKPQDRGYTLSKPNNLSAFKLTEIFAPCYLACFDEILLSLLQTSRISEKKRIQANTSINIVVQVKVSWFHF